MLTLVEAARNLWCPGLSSLEGNPKAGVQEWLAGATYAPIVSADHIILSGIDQQNFLNALAADINRVSSAASESLCNINSNETIPKSVAWPFVKLYYSSLFYAHCVLRVWGRSPTYLRTSDLIQLRQVVAAYGLVAPFKLQTGQFLIAADMPSSAISMAADSGNGGTHEAIWRAFHSALADLASRIESGPYVTDDKDRVKNAIARLSILLTNSGSNSSWLSFMRNNIQYRQSDGVWYPYPGRRLRTTEIETQVTALREGKLELDVMLSATGDDLSLFRAACMAVIILGRGVLADLSRSAGPRGFLQYGQYRFEGSLVRILRV